MASETSIANLALSKLGDEDQIIDLRSGESRASRSIAAVFDDLRDAVLRAGKWNFATARASLPALTTAPAWGYAYAYQPPADFMAFANLQDDIDYRFEGGLILSDATPPLALRYIQRVTDTGRFDSLFVEALACRLAAQVAKRLTGSDTAQQTMMTAYNQALGTAKGVDATENPPDTYVEDDFINCREADY